jgi:hypothetical protein
MRRRRDRSRRASSRAVPRQFEWEQFSYRVTLHDFGDDVLAKEYADVLQAVVSALSSDIPLQDLDGVTIAADYPDALAKLDAATGSPPVPSAAWLAPASRCGDRASRREAQGASRSGCGRRGGGPQTTRP